MVWEAKAAFNKLLVHLQEICRAKPVHGSVYMARILWITQTQVIKLSYIGCQAHHCSVVASGRATPGCNPVAGQMVFPLIRPEPPDGSLDILQTGWEYRFPTQAIVRTHHGIPALQSLQDGQDVNVALVPDGEGASV
jgi:hypothetical protein